MNPPTPAALLDAAKARDIEAFQTLFVEFQDALKTYLYRIVAHRPDAEDLAHDTFIRAYTALPSFRGDASLKTWVFRIGTNLALNHKRGRQRWAVEVSQEARALVQRTPPLAERIVATAATSPCGRYEVKEHIDTCFTCMAKTLPIEQQVATILRDVYDFSVADIMLILDKSEGTVKYLLQKARGDLGRIFDHRCALVNKAGACHQCSELNGWLNPAQGAAQVRVAARALRPSAKYDRAALLRLRTELVRAIDPLRSEGHALQEVLMRCNALASGEGG